MKQTFKRLTAVFVAAVLAVTCLPLTVIAESLPQEEIFAAGDTGEYQGFEYEELEDGTLSITGYTDYAGTNAEVVIPSEIDGKKVTVIGDRAFFNNDSILKITIPDGVTTIGDQTFGMCDNLTAINVDDRNENYKDIDGVLFTKDGKVIIQFPAGKATSYSVPDNATTIGKSAFIGCDLLTKISLPNSVTTIEKYAFSSCDGLTEITLSDNLTTIEDNAFQWCTSLKEITLPYGLTTIGEWTFSFCETLEKIDLPDSVTTIGISAFKGCYSLAELTLSDNLTKIESETFYDCGALTKIIVPNSVTAINGSAFGRCFFADGNRAR